MRYSRFLIVILVSTFCFGQTVPSGFELIAYEGFDYSNGTNISNQSGGTGWSSNWVANYYGNSSMYVYSSGYSYSGLATNGNRLEWGGSGQYQPHSVKRSVASPNSGIVYFQFISDFRSTSGGGTDNVRFYKGGALKGGVGGNGSPHTINILDSGLSNGISSGSAIGNQSLVVMRINYDSNTTKLWVNPNLSSFDYVNPGSADAQAAYDIEFDQIELVFRSGASIDEISVFKLIPLPEISQTKIGLDNSTVSVTFSDAVYGGSANATSTIEASDFTLSMSGGSASLSSATPSSISISGSTVGLGIPLSGTPDGEEMLTITPVSNSVFSTSGYTVSSTQSSNTVQLISNIVPSGLVLYLNAANQNSFSGSGSTWHDLSANQNDGIISGTTFSSNGGEGFIFGGSSSDYITVADDTSLDMDNNQMTISYEITPDLNGSNWSPAIQKGISATACGAGTLNYYTWYGNNDLQIDFEGNSDLRGQLYNATSDDISNGEKIMITITVDQSNVVKTFIDGELKHLLNHSGQVLGSATNGPLVIGYCPDPSGKISSIMIYDRALTSQEIFQNYNALNDIPPKNISLTSNTISETASIGTIIGTLSATDSDTSISSLTFSFTSSGDARDDDNNSFTISGTSLLTSTTLDYETKASYNIYVNVSDGTNDLAKALTVSITNVNEPPIDLSFEAAASFFEYLVVGGGGAGGYGNSNEGGGGGGAGGYLTGTLSSTSGTTYTITVGAGGTGVNSMSSPGGNGGNSSIAGQGITTVTALGGGGGGGCSTSGATGASGGGGSGCGTDRAGASGTAGQGNDGGKGRWINNSPGQGNGGGGGGSSSAGARGQDRTRGTLGGGGAGTSNDISGSSVTYAAGGDGGPGGPGGTFVASNETGNTGNGGDGGTNRIGGNGAKGIVILRYLGNAIATGGTITQNGGYTIHSFTETGNTNFTISSGGTSTSTASFDEDSAVGTVVATLTATDTDTTNLTYSLATGNGTNDQHNSLLTVSGTQLLVASSTISYDNITSLNVNLQVSDGEHVISKAFQINVNDLNRAPTDIGLTSNTISENVSATSVVGLLSAIDSDTSDTHSFTLANSGDSQDDDNDSFTISGTSLILNSSPDYETKASYNIYINVNDGANDFAKAFTVSVTNILEPITDLGFHVSKAYKFNGTNNYIEVPYAAENHPSIFTIELWARLDQTTNNFQSPLSSRYGSAPWNNLSGYNFYAVNGLEKWSFTGGSGAWESINTTSSTNGEIYDGNTLKFGIWTHLASTYDGTTYRFYVNGVLAGSKTAGYSRVGFNSIPARPLRIGAGRTEGSATYFFNGAVDEVRIWNYARTQNEINNEKNAVLSGQEIGLVSYYSFDNDNASNETGVNSRDGTLYNSPSVITRNTPYEANIDEESSLGTIVRTLTATDSDTTNFSFSLVSGNGSNDQHNSLFTISGTQLLVADNIDYETNSTLNIYVQASDGTNTFARALTVNVNDVNEPPVITSTTLAQDNSSIDVTFSEAVYSTNGGSGALEVSDFALSISGGTATLSSTTPSSISVNGNTYTLGLPLVGISDGTEVLTVQPAASAIYDLGSAVASTTQSSNTVTLNPPNAAPSDISLSSSSVNENISIGTLVATLSTTDSDSSDTHTYSLVSGAGDTDNASFSINGANLLTAAAVDYESQNSFSILLQTSDGTASYTESFTISVIDGEDDSDGDGFFDNSDAFPSDPSEWSDNDGDGTGDNADTDDDNDGWSDTIETSCGTNPLNSSDTPSDFDQDGNPDCLDPDDDNDTYPDLEDAFPFNAEEWADNDKDGTGDNADTDDDNDGYLDADEIQCESDPLDSSSQPLDFDVDGAPDCIDDNDDNDYCLDIEDDFPLNRDLCVDTDGDGIDNRYEFDSDNDGVADTRDAFPLDPNESQDTDGDGIGDNEDQDDNNDGFSDEAPIVSKVITPNQPGVESTWKIINIEDYPFTTVRVYAPDGSIVFESTNYQNQWRGNNMRTGSPLPTGPYYFRISYGSVLEKFEDGWLYIFN